MISVLVFTLFSANLAKVFKSFGFHLLLIANSNMKSDSCFVLIYFYCSSMNKSHHDIATELTDSVCRSVAKDISRGNVVLEEHNQSFPLQLPVTNKLSSDLPHRQEELLFHDIIRKRKMLQEELQKVKYDEKTCQQKRPHPMKEGDPAKTKYFRSTISKQDKTQINKILKITQRMENEFSKKNKELELKIKKELEQQREDFILKQKEKSLQKRKQIEQNLKKIQTRKIDRTKQIKDANKQFQRVSKLKFLHQKIDEKWKIIELAEQQQNEKLFEKNREFKKFRIDEIKQHSKRYSEIVGEMKQKRMQNEQKLRGQLVEQSRLIRRSHSTFFKALCLEEATKKQEYIQKLKLSQMLQTKMAGYAATMRERNKLTMKQEKMNPHKITLVDIRTSKSLDGLSLNKLGNGYMKQIHECIENTTYIDHSMPPASKEGSKYINYLTDAKLKRSIKNPEEAESKEARELKELKAILKKKEDKQTKLQRAKIVVEKLDEKQKNSRNMINSIMAKISLIKQFADGG